MKYEITKIVESWLNVFEPHPRVTVSEWADSYRYLSPESSGQPGK